jgi:hypothetical protein
MSCACHMQDLEQCHVVMGASPTPPGSWAPASAPHSLPAMRAGTPCLSVIGLFLLMTSGVHIFQTCLFLAHRPKGLSGISSTIHTILIDFL